MKLKNKEVRALARHLLDDNIFGKDWIKGAVMSFLLSSVVCLLANLLFSMSMSGILLSSYFSSVVVRILLTLVSLLIPTVLVYALVGPISVGVAAVFVDLVRNGERIRVRKFFYGFKNFFENAILGIMYILQIFLWSLAFVIPGIYVAYSYALVFHIKKDHPEYRWKQCFDESERLMEGNRFKLFTLQVSHMGWFILALAFLFVGAYWTVPYLNASTAIFYEEVRIEKSAR